MTPVVVRRQVPGRDRAENCGGSADVPVVQVVVQVEVLQIQFIVRTGL